MKKTSFVRIVISLTAICTAVALLVSGVYALTESTIEAAASRKEREALKKIYPTVADEDITVCDGDFGGGVSQAYKINTPGGTAYAIDLTVTGFGGDIEMVVGIVGGGGVSGIEILSHSETPGLGARITETDFLKRFFGIAEQVVIGENVDAISGATISSKAVGEGVNRAMGVVKQIEGEAVEQ